MLCINCQAAAAQQRRFANCPCARRTEALREAGCGGCAGGVAPLRPYDMAGRDFRCFATAQHDSPLSFPRMRGNQKGASPARKGIGGGMSDFAGLRLGGRLDASLPLSMTSGVGSLAPCVTLSEAKGLRSRLAT